jgi:integrase
MSSQEETMDLILEQYAERLRRKNKSPHTISGFSTVANRFSQWLEAQGVSAADASYELLEEYFDTLPLAPNSKGTHLRFVQAAYNYAIKRGVIRHNPAVDIEVANTRDEEPRIVSNECLRVIRDRIYYEIDWLFFHLLAYTGMRRNEVKTLTWEQVDLPEQTIRVIGKGGKRRLVPIHPALGEVLSRCADRDPATAVLTLRAGKPVSESSMQDMTKRLSTEFTPHDFRRTVATSLDRNGVRENIIDRIMGWAPRDIRNRYYRNVATPELQRAILRLYADDPL